MNIKLQLPKLTDLRPRLTVVGVGGGGSNAINNMIASGLNGVSFVVANTDAQSLANSSAEHKLQLGVALTEGLGAGAKPEIGHAAAEEAIDEIRSQIAGSHMVFIAAGMGGGTGTGAAAVIARIARESGALTVGVVTKPFQFEGSRRMRAAEQGIQALRPNVDTLIVIPNQNLFRIANEKTTFADAFVMADQVLYSGVACIVDLIVKEGLINLDFADVRTIMSGMGTAMMGTGEAAGDQRAVRAAEEAIANPLLDDISLRGARGLLLSITGGRDLTLYEVDEAATRVRQEVDAEANIIVGATFDDSLGDRIRVSIVASGMERAHEIGLSSSSTPFSYAPPQQTHYGTPRGPLGQAAAQASHAGHGEAPAAGAPPVQSAMPAAAWPSNGQSSGQSGGQGDSQSRHDLGRSLTEAIASGGRDQHEPPSSQPQWTSAQGAVFEEAAPHLAMSPAPSVQPQFERLAQPQEPSFSAQPPADVRRGQRRIPDVDDFSDVAQREYRAKSEQYAAASEPRAAKGPSVLTRNAPPPAVEPPRKLGFFERLTGARRREQQVEKVADHPQAPRAASRDRSTAPPGARQRLPSGAPPTSAPHEEDTDLPVFFGQDRKAK